jgi:hypothetical protein
MLCAFFDDSGTHGTSKVVVVGGVMGTESEVLSLDGMWREHLNHPLCGLRPPIREFHAAECFDSRGEFAGWKRTETDYFRHQLREVIIKSHISAYGFACIRQEWDDEIHGDLRNLLGDSEGYAIVSCFVRSIRWAGAVTFDPEISYTFDDRPETRRRVDAVFDAFQKETIHPRIITLEYSNSQKVIPLQAADLIAWELNRNGHKIMEEGLYTPTTLELLELGKRMFYLDAQIARKDRIVLLKEFALKQHDGDMIAAMGDYFKNFGLDPDAGHAQKRRKSQRRKRHKALG